MDPKLLFQLAEIIELGSLSRAAEVLNVTQPTLSRNIRIIETRVGAAVLKRGRYGVVPTEIGEQLALQGQEIRASMQRADEALDRWRAGLQGELRLGVGPMLAVSVMPGLLSKTIDRQWQYTVRVTTTTAARLITRLRDRELDVAVAPSRMTLHMEQLVQTEVFRDRLGIFAGAQSPLVGLKRQVSIEELAAQPWISTGDLSRIHGGHSEVLRAIGVSDVVPRLAFSGDIATPLALMRQSGALAVLPVGLTRLLHDQFRPTELEVDASFPDRNIALWTHEKCADRPEVRDFAKRATLFFARLQRKVD
ncbi:LysR family transcriptional regulator [Alkalilacustris brevis]|uniref:LysR family transcriptional regulator n=1 Tax=Alkalilacustris brevis TaxID=2026338 RepID=UPI000E0D8ED0|nr:LysR family transcriptional regulator [Alkalilacustris brevis]